MTGIEVDKAVIDKHSIPWYDHNKDEGKIVLESSGRAKGLRETFSVIKLIYNKEGQMLKATLEILEKNGESEETMWLIPKEQVKFMSKRGGDDLEHLLEE